MMNTKHLAQSSINNENCGGLVIGRPTLTYTKKKLVHKVCFTIKLGLIHSKKYTRFDACNGKLFLKFLGKIAFLVL